MNSIVTQCGHLSGLRYIKQIVTCRTLATSQVCFAEPLKKKVRVDPAVLRLRTERKIAKTQREIDKIEAEPRQLAPILEYQPTSADLRALREAPERSQEDLKRIERNFVAAHRLWNFYRQRQSKMEIKSIKRIQTAQSQALECLKQLDQKLYDRTVAMDELSLIPYCGSHVRKETPSNPDYKPPDGYAKDATKEWVM